MTRPIAFSCGEPAGIGPEIAAKAWDELRGSCPFFYIGDASHLPAGTPVAEIEDPAQALTVCDQALPVLQLDFLVPNVPGQPDPANAPSVIDAIETGVDLVKAGHASALCTAPIHKKALIDGAGFSYPGHTEFLAALSGTQRVVMMLASDQLRVVPATIHIPLSQVPEALTPDLLRDTIEITAAGLRKQFGIANPRIAIAGLNPHAGEGGKMGTEEGDWIASLVAELNLDGATLTGPHPADTLFHAAARARYDAAIAMYHDQALIPIKTLDFDRGVNVTLGLPFIRTSPDHGTALDIAGKGIATPTSLIEALKLAQRMAKSS
ncbi:MULTISPECIES: 4-hydroxythreonine-4-phosphate dehydrogenase PdxA [unclassified Ruegeria]|uniref:4-hydroxythreonine-4-phosphate dehydrogenase PdxA n=1 Tax=unclassified Ruegeria TaxID=2625375 RepID=UPI00148A000B|nr:MULTISPECIES: 4-hydroxythreonine-4-phosphate dehydrogenase PdxA [unclassified Ruegeria]NOD78045.1 4-hydroxythreonine-4-phosphate dehydrogenase PdxA [Ruegeria sp. HKCCD4332]NOD87629.1 4-hydroxythreonine-4-phosphate dehydrogenase PdxA [Ruegeria sp. HKCCD4318]NOE15662.1 4-hydroxythreonine-4-phosphate dehydrogenase PdxA [Ruegeria sp. HKCCD4318-2]NOG08647.1 4-hydroxythreonine-4-phosphate dehydrogenase PdxA [Ruegeria sp. HKCCD4315]